MHLILIPILMPLIQLGKVEVRSSYPQGKQAFRIDLWKQGLTPETLQDISYYHPQLHSAHLYAAQLMGFWQQGAMMQSWLHLWTIMETSSQLHRLAKALL